MKTNLLRITATAISLLALLSAPIAVQAADQSIEKMKTRKGGMFRVLTLDPGEHFAAAVLLQGGKGRLGIKDDFMKGGKKNLLINFREKFADAGVLVAIGDAPRDHYKGQGMRGDEFRLSQEHADDVGAVIKKLRSQTDKPVWLIGTSRGSISAVNAANRLSGDAAPDGIVLTASVVTTTAKGWPNTFDVDLSKIAVPVLITHHEDDGCPSSPYGRATDLELAFPSSPSVKFITYTGGEKGDSKNRCNRLSPHGYLGQEDKAIQDIIDWLKQHS